MWHASSLMPALGIARDLAASDRQDANQILWNVAIAVADDNPAEAGPRAAIGPAPGRPELDASGHRLEAGPKRPCAARRLVDESQRYDDSPQTYLYLACGLKERDPAAAKAAFWKGIKEIDRLLDEKPMSLAMGIGGGPAVLLPLAEQIDPTLVPEVFWRAALAARPPLDTPLDRRRITQ